MAVIPIPIAMDGRAPHRGSPEQWSAVEIARKQRVASSAVMDGGTAGTLGGGTARPTMVRCPVLHKQGVGR